MKQYWADTNRPEVNRDVFYMTNIRIVSKIQLDLILVYEYKKVNHDGYLSLRQFILIQILNLKAGCQLCNEITTYIFQWKMTVWLSLY